MIDLRLGDCLTELKKMPDESVDCVITSPPYWALRDYGTATWEGGDVNCDHKIPDNELDPKYPQGTSHNVRFLRDKCYKCGAIRKDLQLGLEPTFQEYINRLCDIFDEVKRVLKPTGTCWVNLGDTYANHNPSKIGGNQPAQGVNRKGTAMRGYVPDMQEKCLIQIPSRFAIEMCNRGWILRNEIIWHKPNCMPSSVKDRFTVDFEKVFFFVKNKKYYFETQYEPHTRLWDASNGGNLADVGHKKNGKIETKNTHPKGYPLPNPQGRNKRCVWKITTKPYKEAHFATFPPDLVKTPIKAGCSEGGVVLDPFAGSGTTGMVAKQLGRSFIGIELNPDYIKMAQKRIDNTQTDLFAIKG